MKWTFFELIPFATLGVFGGMLGSLFIWLVILIVNNLITL